MISSSLPHATALLCIIIARALVVNPAPAEAFLAPLSGIPPRRVKTPSSFCRTIETTHDNDLAVRQQHLIRSTRRGPSAGETTTKSTTTSLRLFGNILGNEEGAVAEQREGELARFAFPKATGSSPSSNDVKFDSLSIMIKEWSKLFVADDLGNKKITGLTTPVTVVDLTWVDLLTPAAAVAAENNDDGDTIKFSGVQLLFKKGKTGGRSAYQDKDDERHNKNEKEGQRDNVDATKEGGVEVRVEQLSSGDLRVIASRCEMDEGTLTKGMSEGVIVDSLKKAISAWRKEQAS
ncbi:hypothetical protein ACHAW5_009521 [Stephanodiscus triporus]|uniref:Plastid lipid-associated protein/fibrillin conserved domain-containing protein n=1 Tax=Stephanodiscus triporus TaxID=2934178 RepID=A0ABD3NNJ5_9STRA